ncbi:hypothetical protein M9Y10_010618 [Tritrichomonas musculus]|uniref:Ubiquitin-like domain-containing protein n=1 Tax=Tritrichomonas musculus TaxID=1915356 RepID=A0ABR2IL81_9EUKA
MAPIMVKVLIPNKKVLNIRVLHEQKVNVLNLISIFSQNNKILFISKGKILPYKNTMMECEIYSGDSIFGLYIRDYNPNIEKILNNNEYVSLSDLRNCIDALGPCYEANLSAINKMISISSSSEISKDKLYILNSQTSKEISRIKDLKLMKKELFLRSMKNRIPSILEESKNNRREEPSIIDYEPLSAPSVEVLPCCF